MTISTLHTLYSAPNGYMGYDKTIMLANRAKKVLVLRYVCTEIGLMPKQLEGQQCDKKDCNHNQQ